MATKMKTSLKKLRGALGHERKDRRPQKTWAHLDELDQATQDMKDMRDCYDRLLSAAAATANCVYEFSESLGEMGDCLLEKTALSEDEETGKVLLMLGKVQLELQKLLDGYRSHIFQTITIPSESLLNELCIVEEMKRCCDEKREIYDDLMQKSREKGRLRGSKGECFSSHQLQEASNEYDEETNAFVFRMKSLRQGQSCSLLTQAARHHAAQLAFLRKAVKSLEAIEPHVKLVAKEQHIDYHFSGLEDDDGDDIDDADDNGDGNAEDDSELEDESELSFDCGQNEQGQDLPASSTSMKLDHMDVTFHQVVTTDAAKETLNGSPSANAFAFSKEIRTISKSGPLLPDKKFDPAERLAQMRQLPSQKFSSYVLPTPQETKTSISAKADDEVPQARRSSLSSVTPNLWHSSPLQRNKYEKIVENFSGPIKVNTQSVLKESNDNTKSSRLPPPVTEGLSPPRQDPRSASDNKKTKRQAFSGPLTGKPWPHKPNLSASGPIASSGYPQLFSGPLLRNPMPRPASVPKFSSRVSPTFMSSPKISELHELPRPPAHLARPPHRIAHSGPLVSKSELSAPNKTITRSAMSTLPVPLKTISRSYSIPTGGQIEATLHASKPLETPDSLKMAEDPISKPNFQPATSAS